MNTSLTRTTDTSRMNDYRIDRSFEREEKINNNREYDTNQVERDLLSWEHRVCNFDENPTIDWLENYEITPMNILLISRFTWELFDYLVLIQSNRISIEYSHSLLISDEPMWSRVNRWTTTTTTEIHPHSIDLHFPHRVIRFSLLLEVDSIAIE